MFLLLFLLDDRRIRIRSSLTNGSYGPGSTTLQRRMPHLYFSSLSGCISRWEAGVKSRPCLRNLVEFLLNLSAKRQYQMIHKYHSKENIEKAKKIRVGKNPFLTAQCFLLIFLGGWGYRILLGFIGFLWVFWRTTSVLCYRNSHQIWTGISILPNLKQ